MSSANDHLAPPPKTRMSPLDFRNTDLVSRLLAATPPYLYNMSLLPNTYFFSEMLRSFVHAKNEQTARSLPNSLQVRRSRKRPWMAARSETFQKAASPKPEQVDWLKSSFTETKHDSPLELTTEKLQTEQEKSLEMEKNSSNKLNFNFNDRKLELPIQDQNNSIFTNHNPETSTGLILPPPPPMWYPPLYPTAPYGIDPLHFFIDLRVSGHIYDRKNQKDSQEAESDAKVAKDNPNFHNHLIPKDNFKQTRHTSAFSVPVPRIRSTPMNLSNNDNNEHVHETKNSKFDVKSMGFDKRSNKTSTTYIMTNIGNIYKNVNQEYQNFKNEDLTVVNENNETEEQRQKRVKDLRALIGLELVVDYMNHTKPQNKRPNDENSSTTDVESVDSPALEVVALPDNET